MNTVWVKGILMGVCTAAALRAAEPAAVWVSQPVAPGEAVVVYGGPWTNVTEVTLEGPKRETVVPLKVTDDCVTFEYPPAWPLAAFDVRIRSGNGEAVRRVNAPDVWWVQGDAGQNVTAGGWLRVFGRCIGYDGKAVLEWRDGEGKTRSLPAKSGDLYALRVDLDPAFPAGVYEVSLLNGLDRRAIPIGKVDVMARREPWPERVFDITAYGAVANDFNDDTAAIRAALAALQQAGGGVLHVPRGRFGMRGELALPPKTLLRGAGMALSQLYWLDEDNPSGALVSGTREFGIEDLFLAAGNIDGGIVAKRPQEGEPWTSGHILLRRVRARFLHTDTTPIEASYRRSRSQAKPLSINGTFVRIHECDFYFSKGNSALHGQYLDITRNRFQGPECGYLSGRQVIFEGNDHEYRGLSFGNGSYNVLFRGNRLGGVYGDGDRETFTFDGGDPAYSDKAVACEGTSVTLKPGAWRHGEARWIGEPLYIIGGRGAGQMRWVTGIRGRTVEVDRPWDIRPDDQSHFVLALMRSRLLFLDNTDRDGNPFALYGTASDVVIAGNRLERTGGLHAHGMFKTVPEPSWFVQFLGNRIVEGNAVRGPFSYMVPASDSWLGFFDRGIRRPLTYPQNRVGVMRGNTLENNAFLAAHGRVKNMLMENNLVREADRGIVIASSVQDAIVRGNRFENVLRPLVLHDQVCCRAPERLVAGLSAVDALASGAAPSAAWRELTAEALALSRRRLPDAEEVAATRTLLARAAALLAARIGDQNVSATAVAALFGLDLTQANDFLFSRLQSGREVKIPLGGAYPDWGVPATLAATVEGFEGWGVRAEPPVRLAPGGRCGFALYVTRPDDRPQTFALPVRFTLTGEGWSVAFTETYRQDTLDVTDFLVAGPFRNASGKAIDSEVHPPESRLDVTESYDTLDGRKPWQAVRAATPGGTVDLNACFRKAELATAHAVAIVRATRPLRVRLQYGSNQNTLARVNGEAVGSSARRDAYNGRPVDLREGENVIHLISTHASGAWPLKVRLTAVDATRPGELRVLPADQLFQAGRLKAKGRRGVAGEPFTDGEGRAWRLAHEDTFDRLRVGLMYEGRDPIEWRDHSVRILDGRLAGAGRITLNLRLPAPLRVEYDVPVVNGRANAGLTLAARGASAVVRDWREAEEQKQAVTLNNVLGGVTGETARVVAVFDTGRSTLSISGKKMREIPGTEWVRGLDELTLTGTLDNLRIHTGKGVKPD
ncbi:MAG: glycosyl hydrolase family 28-related protein [Kiritimatiellia bacterium]|jgi:hypothetical protein|nr:glycosyl hydrolase family 28-related protein [Kiritimatiellia bacterium]